MLRLLLIPIPHALIHLLVTFSDSRTNLPVEQHVSISRHHRACLTNPLLPLALACSARCACPADGLCPEAPVLLAPVQWFHSRQVSYYNWTHVPTSPGEKSGLSEYFVIMVTVDLSHKSLQGLWGTLIVHERCRALKISSNEKLKHGMKKLPFRQEAISTIWSQLPSNLPHKARHFSHPHVTQEPHPTDDIAGHHLSDAHLGVSESHLP